MLIYEYKIAGNQAQYAAIDEAIRITQFIRNKCLRMWMDEPGITRNDLQCQCALLAKAFPFAARLNSQARQAAADRAWCAISRFYEQCKTKKPGKKGYPTFQHDNRSVEYKTSGWKIEPDGKYLIFTDGCGIGRVRLVGNPKQALCTFPTQQIKRVRILRRADGYYAQCAIAVDRQIEHVSTGKQLGIDVGLKVYYTDSEGATVDNPRFFRNAEKRLKRLHRQLSRTHKQSRHRQKARKRLAKDYLKVQRQREDFARKTANALITSSDLIAYEDLRIANMVKNHHLAKSIQDAGWGSFLHWVNYYATVHGIVVVKVAPHFTSQDCSACGTRVKKSLSVRTHICHGCGIVLDRDHNAALGILAKALERTVGHMGTDEQDSSNASGQTASTRPSTRMASKRAG